MSNSFECTSTGIDWCDEESAVLTGGYHRYVEHERSSIYKNGVLWLQRCEECEGTSMCLRLRIDDRGRLLAQDESDNWLRASTLIGIPYTLGQTTWIPKALGSNASSL